MNNTTCKGIVQKFFKNLDPILHIDNKSLKIDEINYRIQPDDVYILVNNEIIVIEYEQNKRPVESISKYWWLFEKTDWLKTNYRIELILIITNPSLNNIRYESIIILGDELEKKYPDKFHFKCIPYSHLNKENITQNLLTLIKP